MPKRSSRKNKRQTRKKTSLTLLEILERRQLLTATAGDQLDFQITLTNHAGESLYSTTQNYSYKAPWDWYIPNEGNEQVQGSNRSFDWTAKQAGTENSITLSEGIITTPAGYITALSQHKVREVSANLVACFFNNAEFDLYPKAIEKAWIGSSDNLYSLLVLNQRYQTSTTDTALALRGGNGNTSGILEGQLGDIPALKIDANVSNKAMQALTRIVGFPFAGTPVASATGALPSLAILDKNAVPFKDAQPPNDPIFSLPDPVPTLKSFFDFTNESRPTGSSALPSDVLDHLHHKYSNGFKNQHTPIEIFSELSGIKNLASLFETPPSNSVPYDVTTNPIVDPVNQGANYGTYATVSGLIHGYYGVSGMNNQDAITAFFNFVDMKVHDLKSIDRTVDPAAYNGCINDMAVGLRALMALSYDASPLWSSYGTGYANAANPMVGDGINGQSFIEKFSGQEFQLTNIDLPPTVKIVAAPLDSSAKMYPSSGWFLLDEQPPVPAGLTIIDESDSTYTNKYTISHIDTQLISSPASTSSDTISAAGLSASTSSTLTRDTSTQTADGTSTTLGDLPGLIHDEAVLPNPFATYISTGGGIDVVTGSNLDDVIVGPGHGQGYDRDFHGRLTVSSGGGNDIVAPGRGGSVVELGAGADHVVFGTNDLFGEATFYDFHYHEGDRIIVDAQINSVWDRQTPEKLILEGPNGASKTLRLAGSSDRVWHKHVVQHVTPASSVASTTTPSSSATASPAGEFNYLETHLFVLPPAALPADEVNVGLLTLKIDPATISKTATVPNNGSNSSRIEDIDTTGLRVGMTVSGPNIPTDATISAITTSSNAILLSTPIIAGNGATNVTIEFKETLPPVMWLGLADKQFQINRGVSGGFAVKLEQAFPKTFEALGQGSAYQISVTPYDSPKVNDRGFGSRQAEVFITRNNGYVQSDQLFNKNITTSDLDSVPKTAWRILELTPASGPNPATYAIGYLGGLANYFLDHGMNSNGTETSTTGLQITVDNDFYPGVGQGAPSLSGRMATWGPFDLTTANAIMAQTQTAETGAFAGELPSLLQTEVTSNPNTYIGIKHLTTNAPIIVNGTGRINGFNIIKDPNYRNVSDQHDADRVRENPIYQINSDMFTASSVYQTINTDDSNWAIDISGITVAWPAYRGVGSVLVQDFNNAAMVVDASTQVEGVDYGIDFHVSNNPFFEFRNSKVKVYDYKQVGGWVDRADGPGISAWHSEMQNSFIHTNDDSIKVQAPFYHALNNTILQGNAGSVVGYAYGFINFSVAATHVDYTYVHRVVNKKQGNGYGLAAMRIVPSPEWTSHNQFGDTKITNLKVNALDFVNVGSMNSVNQANVIDIDGSIRGFGTVTPLNYPDFDFIVGGIQTFEGWDIRPTHDLSPAPSQITVGGAMVTPNPDGTWTIPETRIGLLQQQPTAHSTGVPANTTATVKPSQISTWGATKLYASPTPSESETVRRPKLHRSSKIYLNREGEIGPSPVRLVYSDLVQAASYGATAGEESFVVSNVANGSVEKKIGDSWINVSEAPTSSNPFQLLALLQRRIISPSDEIRWVPSAEDSSKATAEAFSIYGWDTKDKLASDQPSIIDFETV